MRTDTLTRDQIVAAAIELLDAEGLDGLTMRALGARLGAAATAMYWHVGSKEQLIALAADRCWSELQLPDIDTMDWRPAATSIAAGLHAMVGRHPWLVQAAGSYVLYGEGKARHDDRVYAIYEKAGFTGAAADEAAATVLAYVLGSAIGPAAKLARERRARTEANADRQLADELASATEIAMRYPRLQERLKSPAEYEADLDELFDFGLRAVLDGLEARGRGS